MPGGLKVVHVCRDNILGSDKHRFPEPITPESQRAWLWTMVMLASPIRNEYRGYLVCGSTPMSFDDWRGQMGYRKIEKARRIWKDLHDRGLFETRELDGQPATYVFGFEKNQDRFRRKSGSSSRDKKGSHPLKSPLEGGPEKPVENPVDNSVEGPSQDQVRAESGPSQDQVRTESGPSQDQPTEELQGVTGENWAEGPIEQRSVEGSLSGSTRTVPVQSESPPAGGAPSPLPLEAQVLAEPNGTKRPPQPEVPPVSVGPSPPSGPSREDNGTERQPEGQSSSRSRGRGDGAPPAGGDFREESRRILASIAATPSSKSPAFIALVEELIVEIQGVTLDFHSDDWFRRLLAALCRSKCGRREVRVTLDRFQSDINHGKIPEKKGACLNWRLQRVARQMGIDVDALRTQKSLKGKAQP